MKKYVAKYQQDDWLMDMPKDSIHFIYIRESSLVEKLMNRWSIIVYLEDPSRSMMHDLDFIPYASWSAFENDWKFR